MADGGGHYFFVEHEAKIKVTLKKIILKTLDILVKKSITNILIK